MTTNGDGVLGGGISPTSSSSSRRKKNENDLTSSPIQLSRTTSTPIVTRVGRNPGSLGYAMRKVFSREERSVWQEQEAVDLVRNDSLKHPSSLGGGNSSALSRVSSRIVDDNYYGEDEVEGDIGAELVLDETDFFDKTVLKEDHSANNKSVADAMLQERAYSDKKSGLGGYKLRRFISTPTGVGARASNALLRRTPSYDHQQTEEDFNEDDESPLHLSRPVTLKRSPISLRLKKSSTKSNNDDDLSTVAESMENVEMEYNERRKEHKRRRMIKSIGLYVFLFTLSIIGVGVYLIKSNNGRSNNSASKNTIIEERGEGDDDTTTVALDTGYESESIIEGNDEAEQQIEVGIDENEQQQAKEAEAVTSIETKSPSHNPTKKPSSAPVDTYTMFHLIADCPYDDNERDNLMPEHIKNLQPEAEFLIHLGDTQYAKVDDCQEYAYREASDILKKSKIPTFVIPGDNDINDCDDHEWGEKMWSEYFKYFDKQWEYNFQLTRWGKLDESFSFLHKQVLYFALNVIGGSPYSKSESENRQEEHIEMIRKILDDLDEDTFKVMVLLGHADPGCGSHHEEFFKELSDIVEDLGKPTIHFHGDYHEYYEVEGGDHDVDNLMRISLDGESISPPISVEIDVSKSSPIKVSRRRPDLKVDCCDQGWPRDEL